MLIIFSVNFVVNSVIVICGIFCKFRQIWNGKRVFFLHFTWYKKESMLYFKHTDNVYEVDKIVYCYDVVQEQIYIFKWLCI